MARLHPSLNDESKLRKLFLRFARVQKENLNNIYNEELNKFILIKLITTL